MYQIPSSCSTETVDSPDFRNRTEKKSDNSQKIDKPLTINNGEKKRIIKKYPSILTRCLSVLGISGSLIVILIQRVLQCVFWKKIIPQEFEIPITILCSIVGFFSAYKFYRNERCHKTLNDRDRDDQNNRGSE